jgi:hypothetical protein
MGCHIILKGRWCDIIDFIFNIQLRICQVFLYEVDNFRHNTLLQMLFTYSGYMFRQ